MSFMRYVPIYFVSVFDTTIHPLIYYHIFSARTIDTFWIYSLLQSNKNDQLI